MTSLREGVEEAGAAEEGVRSRRSEEWGVRMELLSAESCGAGTGEGPACRGPADSTRHHDHPHLAPVSTLPSHQVRNKSCFFFFFPPSIFSFCSLYLRFLTDERYRHTHSLALLLYFIRGECIFFFNPTHTNAFMQGIAGSSLLK